LVHPAKGSQAHLAQSNMVQHTHSTVRLIEARTLVPVVSCANPDGTFLVSANPEFDPNTPTRFLSFFPRRGSCGDPRTATQGQAPMLIADRTRPQLS